TRPAAGLRDDEVDRAGSRAAVVDVGLDFGHLERPLPVVRISPASRRRLTALLQAREQIGRLLGVGAVLEWLRQSECRVSARGWVLPAADRSHREVASGSADRGLELPSDRAEATGAGDRHAA